MGQGDVSQSHHHTTTLTAEGLLVAAVGAVAHAVAQVFRAHAEADAGGASRGRIELAPERRLAFCNG